MNNIYFKYIVIVLFLLILNVNASSQNSNDSLETITKITVTDTSKDFVTIQRNKNYINPFGPVTTIHFDVPREMNVNLSLFDVDGNIINELLNQKLGQGKYELEWAEISKQKSGMNFYSIKTEDTTITKKLVLVK